MDHRAVGLMRHRFLLRLAITVLATPAAMTAQQPDPVSATLLQGVVYDVQTGDAIAGATVLFSSLQQLISSDSAGVFSVRHGILADSLGSFVADDVPPGPQLISVKQIGYHDKVIAFTATGRPDDIVEIPLAPKPFMLDGITAVASNIETMEDRMRSRRGDASAGRGLIRAYDREALLARQRLVRSCAMGLHR